MFVTAEDFTVPPYNLPNLSEQSDSFPDYVTRKEREVLSKIFGRTLYKEFIDAIGVLPAVWEQPEIGNGYSVNNTVAYNANVWTSLVNDNITIPEEGVNWHESDVDNKWLKLRDGSPYVFGGTEYVYGGLKELLVPYITSVFLTDNADSISSVGVVVAMAENSEQGTPANRIAKTWNDFANFVGVIDKCSVNEVDSLCGFLLATYLADYTNWQYTDVGTMNSLNL